MTLYLLDSDAVLDYLNNKTSSVRLVDDLYEKGEGFATCDVVIAEVYAGLHPEREARAATLLTSMEYLAGSFDIAQKAGTWCYEFARRGRALPVTDTIVAATALANGATIITGNVRDYPMPELSVLTLPR